MQDITIAVSEAGSAQTRTFDYKVTLNGEVVSERKLSPVQTSQVREMAMQYLSLLQGGGNPGCEKLSAHTRSRAVSSLPGVRMAGIRLQDPAGRGGKTDHQFVNPGGSAAALGTPSASGAGAGEYPGR